MRGIRGITLIALIMTIIVLLILAGIAITQLSQNGIFGKSKLAKEITQYTSAKEILDMKLMEIQTDCVYEQKEFNIIEITNSIQKSNDITIEKYYMGDVVATKVDIPENLINLKGILVSVDQFEKYKFLIGDNSKVIGATTEEIPDKMEDLKTLEQFEEDMFNMYITNENVDIGEKFYLYDEGKINEAVNEFIGISDNSAEYKTNESSYLYTNALSSSFNLSYIGTKNKINLRDYSKVKCLVSTGDNVAENNQFRLVLNNSQLPSSLNFGVNYKESEPVLANQVDYILELQISEEDKQKDYYVGFIATLKNVRVYKIWLEK